MTAQTFPIASMMLLCGGLALAPLAPAGCSTRSSGSDAPGGSGGTGGTGGGLGLGGEGGDGACAVETFPADLAPLDLHLMLDKSGSMAEDSKWPDVTAALQTFINSSESAGIGLGIQFFPLLPVPPLPDPWTCTDATDCGPAAIYGPCMQGMCPLEPMALCCGGNMALDTSCLAADYAGVARPIAVLPAAAPALLSAMGSQSPDGDATPTLFALQGALSYATGWAEANPTHTVAVVLATDGEPTGCAGPNMEHPVNTVDATAATAQQAATGSPAVSTFVIGVGPLSSALDPIAVAGGTDHAYVVETGGNVTDALIQALVEIRATGTCTLVIPQPTGGQEPDFGSVRVTLFDPTEPQSGVTVPHGDDRASCDPTAGGWYYDDPTAPTRIMLCRASCDPVRLTGWDIEVELGCR